MEEVILLISEGDQYLLAHKIDRASDCYISAFSLLENENDTANESFSNLEFIRQSSELEKSLTLKSFLNEKRISNNQITLKELANMLRALIISTLMLLGNFDEAILQSKNVIFSSFQKPFWSWIIHRTLNNGCGFAALLQLWFFAAHIPSLKNIDREYLNLEKIISSRIDIKINVSGLLRLHSSGSGLSLTTSKSLSPKQVLFTEKSLPISDVDIQQIRLLIGDPDGLRKFFSHFVYEKMTNADISGNSSDKFFESILGAWPRHMNNLDKDFWNAEADLIGTNIDKKLIPEKFSDLVRLTLVCICNCFYSGFFPVSALANHSCKPNAVMVHDGHTRSVTFRTIFPILPEENIQIKYLDDFHFLHGVSYRRIFLLNTWHFLCACSRCTHDCEIDSQSEWIACGHCSGGIPSILMDSSGSEESNKKECFTKCDDLVHTASLADSTPHWVHLPLVRDSDDNLTPQKRRCTFCGFINFWPVAEKTLRYQALEETIAKIVSLTISPTVSGFLDPHVIQIRNQLLYDYLLHPSHWVFNLLLYRFCQSALQFIGTSYELLRNNYIGLEELSDMFLSAKASKLLGIGASSFVPTPINLGSTKSLSNQTSKSDSSQNADSKVDSPSSDRVAGTGGDILVCLRDLWDRIKPFYPFDEAFQLHDAISFLALLSISSPQSISALPQVTAMEVLSFHGKILTKKNKQFWLQIFGKLWIPSKLKSNQPSLLFQLRRLLV